MVCTVYLTEGTDLYIHKFYFYSGLKGLCKTQYMRGFFTTKDKDSHVIPISFRSFSVRVRNIRRSTSCSSSNERYFEKPICSKNSSRSCRRNRRLALKLSNKQTKHKRWTAMPLVQCRRAGGLCVCYSFPSGRGEPFHCFHDEPCLLGDDPCLLCESCSFCTDLSPGGGKSTSESQLNN